MEEKIVGSPQLPRTQTCASCKTITYADYYFCPNCGKKLKFKPLSSGFWTQVGVYLLSLFLPPFGLIPGFNYLRQKGNPKVVGIIAIVLTMISIVLTTYYTVSLLEKLQIFLNAQLPLTEMGY